MESRLLGAQYKKALDLVAVLFMDKKRKVGGIPYVVHLAGVAHIVAQLTDDQDSIVAGLLHDVLEDIPPSTYSKKDMETDFGVRVTNIVATVTHNEEKDGYEGSRAAYIKQVQEGQIEACLVSGADLLYNLTDAVDGYRTHPDEAKGMFSGNRAIMRLDFYQKRYAVITDRLGGDHELVLAIGPVLEAYAAIQQKVR